MCQSVEPDFNDLIFVFKLSLLLYCRKFWRQLNVAIFKGRCFATLNFCDFGEFSHLLFRHFLLRVTTFSRFLSNWKKRE